ncbi:hypothetical protein [Variovorax sp. JS1663]|uniref:hypothetical protein n=1 Tax=Variovorax sp. JS1663 TaxID=1851577 RepID=UPI000B345BB8|nr:hypothetical protein [Variovorax sp. JS1663]OUM00556.1 hypothetical protein A8M77_21045 [Variovorax sp. JS1663]
MNHIQKLVAQRRTHEILARGLDIEICMALGDREGAARALREQNALCAARFAQLEQLEEEGGCYFSLAGEMSRMQAAAKKALA